MSIVCLNNKGIGNTCKAFSEITAIKSLFLTTPDFAFTDATDFADRDAWNAYIAAGSIIPLQGVREQENQDFEDPVIETANGEKIQTFEGQRGNLYRLLYPLDQHKLVRLMNYRNFNLIKGDRNNNIRATLLDDDTQIAGFKLSFFKVWKMVDPDAENAPYTLIQLQEDDPNEWDNRGRYLTPTWLVSRLEGVLQVVTVQAGAIAAGAFTVNVNYVDQGYYNSDGSANSHAISGLVAANFQLYDQTDALLTSPGEYTVTEDANEAGKYDFTTTPSITGGKIKVIASATALFNSEQITLT